MTRGHDKNWLEPIRYKMVKESTYSGPELFYLLIAIHKDSLIAQLVKNQPAMQETLVQFLGGKDPLENG